MTSGSVSRRNVLDKDSAGCDDFPLPEGNPDEPTASRDLGGWIVCVVPIKVIGGWRMGLVRKDARTEFRPGLHLVVAETPEDVFDFGFAFGFATVFIVVLSSDSVDGNFVNLFSIFDRRHGVAPSFVTLPQQRCWWSNGTEALNRNWRIFGNTPIEKVYKFPVV